MSKYFHLFTLLYTASLLQSQKNDLNYSVDFITTKEGFSHKYASSIFSDDLDIKWVGPENGITKYDGYNIGYIKPNEEYKDHPYILHSGFLRWQDWSPKNTY